MIKNKWKDYNLVLLVDNYPVAPGEFFIDDEIRVIHRKFNKIIVVCSSIADIHTSRYFPKSMSLYSFYRNDARISCLNKIRVLFSNVNLIKNELGQILFNYKTYPSWSVLKIMIADLLLASRLREELSNVLQREGIDRSNTILYSYWHDYKAVAAAMLGHELGIPAVARCHGWDIYFERQKIPYLPFKSLLLNNLNGTFSISKNGIDYFNSKFKSKYHNKLLLSRLGKLNDRYPLLRRTQHSILIVSCSNLIALKRVDRIIELIYSISRFQSEKVNWVHFGDGPLRCSLEHQANSLRINADFHGIVDNQYILDYYAKNYVDLFINLSESEGIPVSIMEAQSAGIPVLATSVGGTPEIVNDENGFLVPSDMSIDKITLVINNYLKSSPEFQKNKRYASYQNWKENYSAEKNYKIFLKELESLIQIKL